MKRQIYWGGPILTMEGEKEAEAVLVQDGKILAVGALSKLEQEAFDEKISLEGHTLMPGFVDPHSHFTGCANGFLQCSAKGADTMEALLERIRSYRETLNPGPGEWILVRDFAPEQIKEGRMPDRRELDQASPNHPLVLQHRSGHVGSFNSLGLKALGITGGTPDPEGGRIEKRDGEPTGYLEENAFIQALRSLPMPSPKTLAKACRKAQELYASYGITTLQEGMFAREMIPMYQKLLEEEGLWLDVVGYADLAQAEEIFQAFPKSDGAYDRRLRLGGYKIFLDGSPQSRTAWVRTPYEKTQGDAPEYGTSTMTEEAVEEAVLLAARTGRQLLAHCNGDAAAEQYLSACEKAKRAGKRLKKPVMIHAQLLGTDQIPRLKALGMIPSFFAAHVYHWGDVHIRNLGLERAGKISPLRSAQKEGLVFTLHQDSPVILPDMLETVWCAAVRKTKAGIVLGAEERISVYEALRAVTWNGAYQYSEETRKGSIAPGKLADFVILDRNPLETEPEALREIQVLETIKEGKTVYRKEA